MTTVSQERASWPGRAGVAVVGAMRWLRWWYAGVSGESRYAAYLAHHQATHPDATPMTEREFWVQAHRDAESHPQGGCC